MKRLFYLTFAVYAVLIFSACRKHKNEGTTTDLIKDSIYLYTKECYYWNDALPAYDAFNPRAYSGGSDIAAFTAEVNALSQYKINPATNRPYEYSPTNPGEAKYSFIDNGQTSAILGGTKVDFGFAVTAISATDLRIRYVYAGSPAGNANMHRGDQIVTVNGHSNLNVSLDADYKIVTSALQATPISLTLKRSDNSTYNVTLTSASYTINPVITYKTFDEGNGKQLGYIVFNVFTAPANAEPRLDEAFNYFTTKGITDLVVDLRYNGGGYVSTSEYLANLIVPSAKNGSLMYNTYFNSILTSGQAQILKHQYARDENNTLYTLDEVDYSVARNAVKFVKKGSLNVSRVFFIVTDATASASELAINNLRSQLDVKLLGRTTYGKPVGFFALNINQYQLYVPEFETKNSANQGGYYTGMAPGSADYPGFSDADDLTHDFGDPAERLLAHALSYVKLGTYGNKLQVQSTAQTLKAPINLGAADFNNMILDRKPGK